MAKVIVEGVEVEESELTAFQKQLYESAIKILLKTAQREVPYVPDSERIRFINSIDKEFPKEIYEGAFKSELFSELVLFLRLNRQGLIEDIEKRTSRLAKSDFKSKELVKKIKARTNKLSNFNLSINERESILAEKEEFEKIRNGLKKK